jgi:nitrogen fixation NifU-like protein
MSSVRDLYQELILDHGRSPRNFRRILRADRSAEGFNPLCGDQVAVSLALREERIEDIAFQGSGCAISMASASLMTASLKGKALADAQALAAKFHALLTNEASSDAGSLGKLGVFEGVRAFPVRVKCATLPWHTLVAAIEGRGEAVSTE